MANFLGKPVTEEQLTKLTEHLRVENFAKNPAVNFEEWSGSGYMNAGLKFVRKGKISLDLLIRKISFGLLFF